jgi:hypothetical protein
MSTFTGRGLMCIAMTLTALSSFPALAELPTHRRAALLGPRAAEAGLPNEENLPQSPDFGASVAIRDGIVFVGIPNAQPNSHVAVYAETATGWQRTATLAVSDSKPPGALTNGFGSAIAFRDGVAVIASSSLLHVFTRNNGVWTDIQRIPPPPKDGPTQFWEISAMHYENGILAIGSSSSFGSSVAYIYERAATGRFVWRTTLRAPGSFPGDLFGRDVGVAGNTVVVSGGVHNAVFVFKRKSDGTWVRTQKLVGADTSPIDSFGAAVAIDRNLIIVGAPGHDCYGGDNGVFCGDGSPDGSAAGGAAYGFVPIGGQYVQVFKLRPRSDESFNYWSFGRRIAMSDRYVVIDAAKQQFIGDPEVFDLPPGLAFTYTRDGATLTARGLASGYVASDSMASFNRWLVVGSVNDLTRPSIGCRNIATACFGEVHIFDLSRFAQ